MFLNVKTPEEVFEILAGFEPVSAETIPIDEGLDRVLALEARAGEDLPGFSRSSMDGYAVQAKDTFGASESLPAFLELAGEVAMGSVPAETVTPGKAIRISTGGMIPEGADAVVMVEYGHVLDDRTIEVSRAVAPLENIILRGDDFRQDDVVFERGTVLRPQDIGVLAGLGITEVLAHRRPVVAILSTGDEVVPIETHPAQGQVRDINSHTLGAFCAKAGALPVRLGLCGDDFDRMRSLAGRALDAYDTLWISGGSSVGARDLTVKVLESFDDAHVLVHGIAISPGKPTIIARIGSKAVFGLPGHVASAMVVAEVFLAPFLSLLSGEKDALADRHHYIEAVLEQNVESASGRDDYIRVRLIRRDGRLFAQPIYGKSGLISTLAQAQGLIRIDRNAEGLYEGQTVRVMLFRPLAGEL